MQRKTTENEALKAIKAHPHWGGPQPLPDAWAMSCPPRDFYTKVLHTHENKTLSHRFVASNARERLLALTAMWDCINMHPLYIRGRVNIEDVSERLKKVAKWDRQGGPVFEEREIINAIERSITSGSDELLS